MTTLVPAGPVTQDEIAGGVGLLDVYAEIGPNDRAVICYTPDSRTYAAHVSIGLRARRIGHTLVPMRPLTDDALPARLRPALPDPDDFAGSLVVVTIERDTMSHFEVFAPLFAEYGQARCKILRIISASDEFFGRSLTPGPRELSDRNATLLGLLRRETRIEVTAPGGTRLRTRCGWRSPDSEAVSFDCADAPLRELVQGCFDRPYGRKVGELGFGTNDAIGAFVPDNSHLNERHPSLHIGFGQHNQQRTVVPH